MFRFIAVLLLLASSFYASAAQADDPHVKSAFAFAHRHMWGNAIDESKSARSGILVKYFTWEYLRDPGSEATFDEITGFIDDNPDWPDQAGLLKHAEVALLSGNPSDATLEAWFAKHPPQTALAKRLGAQSDEALAAMIRDAWVTDDYSKDTESRLLAKYHGILRYEDHIRRIDRLLWEGKLEESKRLLKYVPYNYQRLFQARISLAEDQSHAPVEVVNVPAALRNDPGLQYERIRWRMREGDKDGVRELLLSAPKSVPYPEKWWSIRERQIREALGEDNPKLAEALLARHAQKEGTISYKEAKWLEGFVALEYNHDAKRALSLFEALYSQTQTPGSKSRVAYWAARAEETLHQQAAADKWLSKAARYPTTFYGQMAAFEADPQGDYSIHSDANPSASAKAAFRKRELVQLVFALGWAHETDAASRFIIYIIENADNPDDIVLATRLGRDINRIDFSVRASKKALSSDVVALESGWPVIRFTHTQGIERSLLLALSRQESEFYANAVSPSGAIGLMQLLPGTAKEIAHKNALSYSSNRLYEPDFNMNVGSLYLEKMLDHYDGSYVLAIASYNAGPGRVGQWIDMYGRPGRDLHAVLSWIERIPTSETRNYVQHVMENVQVYRYVLGGKPVSHVTIADDLLR